MKKMHRHWMASLVILLCFSTVVFAQNDKDIWFPATQTQASEGKALNKDLKQNRAAFYKLDIDALKAVLKTAPDRSTAFISNVTLKFPNSQGVLESYSIQEAPLLKSDFQSKHPDLRTYVGVSTEHTGNKIRFSITPQGLHVMGISSGKGIHLIDPVAHNKGYYMVYKKSDLMYPKTAFACGFDDDSAQLKIAASTKSNALLNANDGTLRTYDLALASTVEYSTFHIDEAGVSGGTDAEKKAAVLAAMMVTMNRVNGIFENELSLTMQMVDNTDLIFLAEPDGYTNDDGSTMLQENQNIIDAVITPANYDIGHVFSTGGGGIAQLNSPCVAGFKAQGVTGLSAPVGDIFDVEYVAHEMGHQYGAPHTWTSSSGGCSSGQWSSTNSYEPGSGTTIMSYAGLCSPDNVQTNADDYFHQKSLQVIWANISSGNSSGCPDEVPTFNDAPTANAGADYTIPISTPFRLTGSSSDTFNTGTHTFTWEQYDLAASQGSVSETNTTGPLIRSFKPTTNPVRHIPRLEDLRFSNGSSSWEILPAVARDLNFQLTVRDNGSNTAYGQTDNDGMTVTVVDANGPFKVTSQSTYISYPVGSSQTVTWDVADTNLAPMSTTMVTIKLSTDGGLTYPTVLASTANDGSASVTFPGGVAAPFCRIMVEADASQNIFFAINEADFAIGYTVTETCNQYLSASNLNISIPDATTSGQPGTVVGNTINVPDNGIITSLKVNVDVTHTYASDVLVQLDHPNNSTKEFLWALECDDEDGFDIIFDDGAPAIVCSIPPNGTINGTFSPSGTLGSFNTLDSQGNWNLLVADFEPVDEGTLNDWYLDMCITTITLNDPDLNEISSLKVYPNPSKGDFTITLDGSQSKYLDIEVFDMRGRQIFKHNYETSVNFEERISLKHAQTGIYILNVNDGMRKSTKKLVIN